jgi:hypothetical protein
MITNVESDHIPPIRPELTAMEHELDHLCQELAKFYISQGCSDRNAFVEQVASRLNLLLPSADAGSVPSPPQLPMGELHPIQPTPELMEWARQQFNEAELAEAIQEIEATGGLKLSDFIDELEKIAAGHE